VRMMMRPSEMEQYALLQALGGMPQISVTPVGLPNRPVNMEITGQSGGVNTLFREQLEDLYRLFGMLRGIRR